MPRDGSGVYSKPSGTTAAPNTTIESAKFNSVVDDFVTDANAARPVTSGGTGATDAATARTNLGVTLANIGADQKQVYAVKSGNYTAVVADNNAFHTFTGATPTLSLTAAATLAANWHYDGYASGGPVIIDPNSSELINGATTVTVPQYCTFSIKCDGSAFTCVIKTSQTYVDNKLTTIQLGTSVATTSGTSIDFTSIPSGVKRITVMFNGVSLSGTDDILVQIGPSGGVETSGYISGSGSASNSTSGFIVRSAGAVRTAVGAMTIRNMTGSTWVEDHSVNVTTAADFLGAGAKTITGTLSRVRITVTGANTFDAGAVNIAWEF